MTGFRRRKPSSLAAHLHLLLQCIAVYVVSQPLLGICTLLNCIHLRRSALRHMPPCSASGLHCHLCLVRTEALWDSNGYPCVVRECSSQCYGKSTAARPQVSPRPVRQFVLAPECLYASLKLFLCENVMQGLLGFWTLDSPMIVQEEDPALQT